MEGDFRVGDWLIQPQLGTVTQGETSVQLEPRVMEVLVYLARHGGQVLPKERIIKAVWSDTVVSDDALKYAIVELRKALRDDVKHPRVIQTLPRRGYRLIAPVLWKRVEEHRYPPGEQTAWSLKATWLAVSLGVVGVALGAALVYLGWRLSERPGPQEAQEMTIAVLPFVDMSPNGAGT